MGARTPSAIVLGVAQDGGHPQVGCYQPCCAGIWDHPDRHHLPAAMGISVPGAGRWLVEATPALPQQLHRLERFAPRATGAPLLDGLLMTHAHMGHLIGLAYLGTEAAAVRDLPVYLPAGLAARLKVSVPWSGLIAEGRIRLCPLQQGDRLQLGDSVTVEVLEVPHRREWSETLAFVFSGPRQRILFLPDIDHWTPWERTLVDLIRSVDAAWIDGTFYADGELARDMSAIPHPRVVDTMARLAGEPASHRARVRFSHLNHTNPLLDRDSAQYADVVAKGFQIAWEGEVVEL